MKVIITHAECFSALVMRPNAHSYQRRRGFPDLIPRRTGRLSRNPDLNLASRVDLLSEVRRKVRFCCMERTWKCGVEGGFQLTGFEIVW